MDLLQHCAEVETQLFLHFTLLIWIIKILKSETRHLRDALDSVYASLGWLNELAD